MCGLSITQSLPQGLKTCWNVGYKPVMHSAAPYAQEDSAMRRFQSSAASRMKPIRVNR